MTGNFPAEILLFRKANVPERAFQAAVRSALRCQIGTSNFMFQLTAEEANALRCQIGTSKVGRGGSRYLPFAFTEQGVAMLSSVLRSERAVQVNVAIMRAFVSLRRMLASNETLAGKLAELERRLETHDRAIKSPFDAIRELAAPPAKPRREMGFHIRENSVLYRTKTRSTSCS